MNENIANEHPLTEKAIAHLWNTKRDICAASWEHLDSILRSDIRRTVYAAFDAGREHERTRADDGWEPLGDGELRVGDEVRRVVRGVTSSGVVGSLDADGDPWTAEGSFIGTPRLGTWSVRRAPVTWHRLPTEHPAHLTDVTSRGGDTCAYMALTRRGDWAGVNEDGDGCNWVSAYIAACTLDGTRLIRDGWFEDDTPRFREEAGE